jgi:hypothetical protein
MGVYINQKKDKLKIRSINISNAVETQTTCSGIEEAERSQTLKGLCANLSREPTSQRLMSPTFVPTKKYNSKGLSTHQSYQMKLKPFFFFFVNL